jgi:hypothetical protein
MKSLALVTRRVVQRFGCNAIRITLLLPLALHLLPGAPAVQAQGSSVRVETFAFKPNGSVTVRWAPPELTSGTSKSFG